MDNLKLIDIIKKIMNNNEEALEFMHEKFKNLLIKYANFLSMSITEITSEFDLIIINIYNAGINDDKKILKYIKTAFVNLKNTDKNKIFFYFEDTRHYLETELYFMDIIKNCDCKTKKLLKLRFINQYSYKEIGEIYGVTRQCVYKKIKRALKDLEKII